MRRILPALLGLASVLAAGDAGAMEIKEVTTPLGIKAWLVEDKSAPIVALSFSFAGGRASEPEGQKGVTSLMATMLTDGAGPLDSNEFRLREQDVGTSLGFSASPDHVGGSLRMLSANRDQAFDLLRLVLTQPRFDAGMLEQRRAQMIAGLNRAEQRPPVVAQRAMMATMFEGHPYALDSVGVRENLRTLTAAQLRERAAVLLVRGGLIVAAVGDIEPAELARQLDRSFGALPLGAPRPALPEWTPPAKPHTIKIERPVPQSSVLIAMPAIRRDDPDWYAAVLVAQVLGGGQHSRLFNEVREKRGLAYGVDCGLRISGRASLMVVSTASANERVAEAIGVIRAELERMRAEGASEQELADAKTYVIGSAAVSMDSSSAIAGLLHSFQIDGQPIDYIDRRADLIGRVTRQDVQRVARRLLRDEAMTTVVVGQPQGISGDP